MENAVLVEDTPEHKEIPLTSHQFSIGRGLDNSLVVDDISVSRKHTLLEFKDNEWYIYDTSSNGTWLNSICIDKYEPTEIRDGDVLKLSDSCKFMFKIQSTDLSLGACCQQMTNAVQVESDGMDISDLEFVEDELQCSVCTEMFIDAITLGCSHTFCNYCITLWKTAKGNCPICRTPVAAQSPAIVLDSCVEEKVNAASDAFRKHRMDIVADRKLKLDAINAYGGMLLNNTVDDLIALISDISDNFIETPQFMDDGGSASDGGYNADGDDDDNDDAIEILPRRRCVSDVGIAL